MLMHTKALFTLDVEERLLHVNEPGNAVTPAPRFFLGRTREGNVWRFRTGLPAEVAEELDALCREEPTGFDKGLGPRNEGQFLRLLESYSPVERVYSGPAYYFGEVAEPQISLREINERSAELLSGGFEDLLDEMPHARPFVAVVADGRAVSVCRSVRITRDAHEAGVETLPEFRGRGLAVAVTEGWAKAVAELGALPMYSTSWGNEASQAVARKLGLIEYGADFQIG